MPIIRLGFYNHSELILDVEDTELGHAYCQLVQDQYQVEPPILRDELNYTVEYLDQLVEQANQQLGTNWNFDHYDLESSVEMHKTVEQMVGLHSQGFHGISENLDTLLHELHRCLHMVQESSQYQLRNTWLQVEWFNDNEFNLPDNFKFADNVKFGALRLQNPYVGHPPLKVFTDNDYTDILTTCRFHDRVKPGIVIATRPMDLQVIHSTSYQQWWQNNAQEFINKYGMDKIMYYSGMPVVGQVRNLDALHQIINSPTLKFEYLSF